MATKKKRRKYSKEFKAEAVKLVLEQGLTRAQASRDLGVAESVLGRWGPTTHSWMYGRTGRRCSTARPSSRPSPTKPGSRT